MKLLFYKKRPLTKTAKQVIAYVEKNGLGSIRGLEPQDDYQDTAKTAEYLGWVYRGVEDALERVTALLDRDITLFDYKYEQGEITRKQLSDIYADEIEQRLYGRN